MPDDNEDTVVDSSELTLPTADTAQNAAVARATQEACLALGPLSAEERLRVLGALNALYGEKT